MGLDTVGKRRFEYSDSLSGSDKAVYRNFRIAAATVIERGEMVTLAEGLVVAVSSDTAPVLGVAKDPHDSVSEGQKGTIISVYCSPDAVFRCITEYIATAEAGSGATTIVDASLSGGDFANDDFNGGYVKAVDCASVVAGTVIRITDFVAATGTFTTASGTFAATDTVLVFPPVGNQKLSIDADGTNINMEDMSASIITVVEVNPEKEESILVTINEHLMAADIA